MQYNAFEKAQARLASARDSVAHAAANGFEEYSYTFIVAFCSFVYEMAYSELLTVIFGGGAIRYATTIGLYMFSLGMGSFVTDGLESDAENFQRLETYMALAPLGFVFIVGLTTLPLSTGTALIISHLPVIAVGFLSGMEIPFVTTLLDKRERDDKMVTTALARNVGGAVLRGVYAFLGLFFGRKKEETTTSSFSEILGVDYLGSLVGAVTYALLLYPDIGLIPTVFILGFLNAAVGVSISLRYSETSRVFLVIGLLLCSTYGGIALQGDAAEDALTQTYLKEQITSEYNDPSEVSINITEHETTRYQEIVWYKRTINNGAVNDTDTCMRLDTAIQMCDSWVKSYHSGLVDVPMTMYDDQDQSELDVLIIGGGDWIAINRLRDYGADVDHVDIDRQFYEYSKNHSFLERYHDNAYKYENLTSHPTDIFTYLDNTDKEYDMILLDIPGAKSTETLPLYSVELYTQLRNHLTEQGVVVSWKYSPYWYPDHHKAYMNTVSEAGFNYHMDYHAYEDTNGDGEPERTERFIILSPDKPNRHINPSAHPYTEKHERRYEGIEWYPVETYEGVDENSIFHPNYDIIIEN